MEEEHIEQLKKISKKEGRPMSAQARYVLVEYINRKLEEQDGARKESN